MSRANTTKELIKLLKNSQLTIVSWRDGRAVCTKVQNPHTVRS